MKKVEIFKIRAWNQDPQKLLSAFNEIVRDARIRTKGVNIKFFTDGSVPGDYMILVDWNRRTVENQVSPLGLEIKMATDKFGLIDHSTWVEQAVS